MVWAMLAIGTGSLIGLGLALWAGWRISEAVIRKTPQEDPHGAEF